MSLADEYRERIPEWATHIGRDRGGCVLVFDRFPSAAYYSFHTSYQYDILNWGDGAGLDAYDEFLIEEIGSDDGYEDAEV